MSYKEYAKKENNMPYKKISSSDLKKHLRDFIIKTNPRGTFKYVNVVVRSKYFAVSVKMNKGRMQPKFVQDFSRKYLIRDLTKNYSYGFTDLKTVLNDFLGFVPVDYFISKDDYLYFFCEGNDLLVEEEEKEKEKTVIDKLEEIKEIAEGALVLSDNDTELKFVNLILEKLLN